MMTAIFVIIVVIFILGFLGWLIFSTENNETEQLKIPNTEAMITIACKDGFIKGHYTEGSLFEGKKYISNRLTSEGTFFNGIQIGQGKEYHRNRKLKYKGNFANDFPSGQGILYDESGQLKYLGYFANGYASGQGRLYDEHGNIKIEGHFARMPDNNENTKDPSVPTGLCKEYYDNGQLKYDGEFNNGIWQGQGKYYDKNGVLLYKGKYFNGAPDKR
ncbi:MAG: toxin-antitoxin system YwqK family antitoxin [Acetobacterium sp.]